MADNDDLLIKMVEQLRMDLAADRRERQADAEASRESRARTHQRIDDVVQHLGRIDTSIAIAGQVDAQVRSEVDQMQATLEGLMPTVDEMRTLKRIGIWAAGALLAGGVGLGAVVAAMGDTAINAIRSWLRIH
jgi:hypothetical protein